MKKLVLTIAAAAGLWLLAPDDVHAQQYTGYVCRITIDGGDNVVTYRLYSGPGCTGIDYGTHHITTSATEATRQQFHDTLVAAATAGMQISFDRISMAPLARWITRVVLYFG